jgi:hypothetical protein
LAIAGLAAAASLTLATAACGSHTSSTGGKPAVAASTAPADPKEILARAAGDLTKSSLKVVLKGYQQTLTSSIDPVARNADVTVAVTSPDGAGTFSLREIGADFWVKLDYGKDVAATLKLPAGWVHVDRSKLKDQTKIPIDYADPSFALVVVNHIVEVTGSGGHYSGTADLTHDAHQMIVDHGVVSDLAARAKTLAFEATVDAQGRLSLLKVKVPDTGAKRPFDVELAISDIGAPLTLAKPAKAPPAPAGVYQIFNEAT